MTDNATVSTHRQPETNKQRVLLIGASGLIGGSLRDLLETGARALRYEVIGLSRSSDPKLDLEDRDSIIRCFAALGPFDHVVVTAGEARFAGFEALDHAAFDLGLRSKLMGQVNLTLAAVPHLPEGGSVTLTSGALAQSPFPGSAPVALVNGALESFVRAIALDIPDTRRVNVVSPGWIEDTLTALGMDPSGGVSAHEVARRYVHAIEGDMRGQVLAL
ncbi:short chain dehydrogenase [Enhygromyxa salina]|uniref:Short chain dehydrogenase n=1 Tax=Enhygromyxa salina TaxID=215803 RepID=A0A2S9XBY2_9BACT|nr:short chain dehydrogenase [Enhygromyxa salina]PRP90191.1 short chain dehydrogenase [Enhygromyxa salina]